MVSITLVQGYLPPSCSKSEIRGNFPLVVAIATDLGLQYWFIRLVSQLLSTASWSLELEH